MKIDLLKNQHAILTINYDAGEAIQCSFYQLWDRDNTLADSLSSEPREVGKCFKFIDSSEYEHEILIEIFFGDEVPFGIHGTTIPKQILDLIDSKIIFDTSFRHDTCPHFGFGEHDSFKEWSNGYRYTLVIDAYLPNLREDEFLPRFVIIDNEKGDQVDCYDDVNKVLSDIKRLLEDENLFVNGYKIRYNSIFEVWQVSHGVIGVIGDYTDLKNAIGDCLKG